MQIDTLKIVEKFYDNNTFSSLDLLNYDKKDTSKIICIPSINNLNLLLSYVMLHVGILADKMDKKLLLLKIIEESKSLKNKAIVWFGQISKDISNILKNAKSGIKVFEQIETKEKFKQLEFRI